jgi:chaperonin GroES
LKAKKKIGIFARSQWLFYFIISHTIMVKLVPIEDHLLVEAVAQEKTTPSGIVLPDTSKEKPSRGTVVAVGQGKILDNGQRAPIDVKVGQVVYFTKYAPDELEVKEGDVTKTYLVIRHSAILAVEE